MQKNYVLDTNVLIQAPNAIESFEDNNVIIPLAVVEELDNLKNSDGEKGANSRSAIRILEGYRQSGDLLYGVKTSGGGSVRIDKNHIDVMLPESLFESKNDNRILKVCRGIEQANPEEKVILVTKDIVLRLKAQIIGICTQDYMAAQVADEYINYTGRCEVFVDGESFSSFKKNGLDKDKVYQINQKGERILPELFENQFIILKEDQSTKKTHLGIIDGVRIVPLQYKKQKSYGVKPQNVGQIFLQEALMEDPEKAPLVIIKGKAGTAKTFYSLAVGLERTINSPIPGYRKILITRRMYNLTMILVFFQEVSKKKYHP